MRVPEPEDSGSAGTQKEAPAEVIPPKAESQLAELGFAARAIQGLASSSPNSIGGEAQAALISGIFLQVTDELNRTRSDLEIKGRELSGARSREAILTERLHSIRRVRTLNNIANLIGLSLGGLAIQLYNEGAESYAMITGLLAFVLIIFGLLSTIGTKDP